MRRNAVTLVVSLFAVSMLCGCNLFKKKDAVADAYDPAAEGAMPAETYSAYPTTGGYTGGAGARHHTVQKKDTLYALARQYYNDQSRWKDIYEANRTDIGSDPSRIRVGQRLVIP